MSARPAGHRRRLEGLWAWVCVALLCTACGDTPSTPATATPSGLASDYLNEVLDVMQANSLNRARINWTDFRAQVTQRAQGAQTFEELYPSISLALGLLDDHHSYYQPASGNESVGNPTAPLCSAAPVAPPAIPADIGYVRIAEFTSTVPGDDVVFADAIQRQIESQDVPELSGWIVDVRGNGGGSMWPMIAGVGPVLGEGVAGYFDLPSGPPVPWGYEHGAAFAGNGEGTQAPAPYTLSAQAPKVAVLTDSAVASSGEAVVVAFRARPDTRSFGSATCGQSTANQRYFLSDNARLYLTVAVMADRTLTSYGQSIVPDEPVSGDSEVVQAGIAWLRGSAY